MKQELYELTNPQKPIWLTEQYFTDTAVNTICGYTFITDTVNLEVLKKAIYEMVKSNDGMRLKINSKTDTTLQYVSDFEPFDIPTVELSTKEDIEKKALEMASTPFMQPNEFLFQFLLFKLPNETGGFIVNVHHLIGDSWSLGLIAKEVTTIYSELLANTYEEKNYPSYLNYIEAENNYKDSEKYLKDKAYWEEVFTTIPEIASLNFSKESQKDISCQGSREKFTLSEKDLMDIKTFCDTHRISVYNFFMAVYSLYVSRVSHLDDFVMGTPILNRTNFDQKHTMGMFISVVPLRVTINQKQPFLDFAKKIATDTMSLFRHQKYSYQSILEDIRKRDSSIPNLYNVILSYQITKTTEESNHVHYSTDWVFNSCSADELQIHLFDLNEEAMTVAYDYKSDVFTSQEIANLHARILAMIKQIITNEVILLNEIEIVTPEEKHQILYDFNDTSVDYPRDKTIVDLFEEQVQKTPDATAVIFEEQSLTYRELNEKANQLARHLKQLGVSSQDVVGVSLKKTPNLIISIFAILKCNAIYMPIFTDYPDDRINYMLDNANVHIMIGDLSFHHCLPTTVVLLMVDEFLSCPNAYDTDNFELDRSSLDCCYIIYTSGSTGKPKGVQISNRNLINFVYSFKEYFKNINHDDIFFSSTNISFDVCIWEIFTPLLFGAKLVFNTQDIISDIMIFCNNIMKYNVNALYIPPNILGNVYDILSKYNYHKINKLLVGVEPISNTTLNNYLLLNPNMIIINGYGPTETTICATALTYSKDLSSTHNVSIGKPLNNNAIRIMQASSLVPIGVPGEICVSGDGVGLGYLNNPSNTNASFVTDPFNHEASMYRTGDIGKWNSDGTITFVGREDNQIKLHGYRIELGEIDSVLMDHPLIEKSLSIVFNNNIFTYLTCHSEISSSDLKVFLKEKLPFYMIPKDFIVLNHFPLTVNGKIDKKQLPKPSIVEKHKYVPPKTDTQKLLCSIWSQLFNKPDISITDNFFDLGGDSLSAIRLQTEALKYGLNINYGSVFNNPTIELLSNQDLFAPAFNANSNYDYESLNKLISINSKEFLNNSFEHISHHDILLFGATGFLGAHILDNLLTNTNSKVYCLVRNKNHLSSTTRLMKTLNFYFGNKYDDLFHNRIFVIEGDICQENLGLDDTINQSILNNISVAINSAALVKHYGNINDFKNINIGGTKNIINFCLDNNIKLYHISTISVSGMATAQKVTSQKSFNETNFYINQNLDNAYIYTKFESEALVLEAIRKGLDGCILRIGNVFNRLSDGKFQINYSDNAYINRLKSFINLEMIPEMFKMHSLDFTPVDCCADAITKIIFTKHNFTVFHLFNTNLVTFLDLILSLNKLGYHIDFVDETTFKDTLNQSLATPELKDKISGIIPDLDYQKNLNFIFEFVPVADFTNAFLDKLNFKWPHIDFNYFSLFMNYFKNINFLN